MPSEFYVHNLGCKLNRVESDALGAALLAAGASAVARDEAQVVIVNTCTVTAEAEAKTRKAIRQALAGPTAPWVIATGCAIAIDIAGYQALGPRVVAEPDRLQAQSRALTLLGLSDVSAATATSSLSSPANGRESLRTQSATPHQERAARHTISRSRLGIKIQDGCDGICSYCIVRVARGPARSIPLAQVREQARAAEQQGFRELVLTGVNIGSYNDGGRHFTQLVAELLNTTTETRI
ncbi:MAG: radical SAM protein, partial [Coriobacteriales bacterium]|nr:radical SAM protein [Coriobacteriales bacterium]